MPEIGQTTVIAEALHKVADSFLKEIADAAKGAARKSFGKLQAEFGTGFARYIERNQKRCRLVKTLLHRVDPISIDKAYVDPTLLVEKKIIEGNKFAERLDQLGNVVVVGTGGSGKSIFVKRLFLSLCEDPFGRIPIFIELRDINQRSDKDLTAYIFSQWVELIPSFTFEALQSGFRAGKFYLLLDGLDEIDKNIRDEMSKQILQFVYKYSACPIVITSRPDDRFASWAEFYVAKMLPFDKKRINELINKIEIDEKIKENFLKEVERSLFRTHREFLSNPLLCTMMLMTYNEFEEIPSKMHIFYARAFDVLFTRHDKTKTFFQRKFYTSLAEDDFKRLFSTFCFMSYADDAFSFDRDEGIKIINAALKYDGMQAVAGDYLADLHESISILTKEGEIFSFLHRSFQEYFTAVFLAERQLPRLSRVFRNIMRNYRGDNVIRLLFEINRDAFETRYFASVIREFRKAVEKIDFENRSSEALALVYTSMNFDNDGIISSLSVSKFYAVLNILSDQYNCEGSAVMTKRFPHGEFSSVVWNSLKEKKTSVAVSSISDDAIKQTAIFSDLIMMRDEIVALDNKFKRNLSSRGNLVTALLSDK